MTVKTKKAGCLGCLTYEKIKEAHKSYRTRCHFNIDVDDKRCPCEKCMIKVICNQPCNEFKMMYPKEKLLDTLVSVKHAELIEKHDRHGNKIFIAKI